MGGGLAVSVPVLRLPPAIAATEELCCTSDGHFSIAQDGCSSSRANQADFFFSSQQCVCVCNQAMELLCWDCFSGVGER